MNETYKVRKVGGALVVTLPQHVARFTKLLDGDRLTIVTHKNGTIILTPVESQVQRERRARNGAKK